MNENMSIQDRENGSKLMQHLQNFQIQDVLSVTGQSYPPGYELSNSDVSFYKIEKLSYDEDYPHREAFENVLSSLDNDKYNFVYILQSEDNGTVGVYVGIVKNCVDRENISAKVMGDALRNSFQGNFSGSALRKVIDSGGQKELSSLLKVQNNKYKYAGVITGIPSIGEVNGKSEYDFQGIDRLINSMAESGSSEYMHSAGWRLAVVCEPVLREDILEWQNDVYDVYNQCAMLAKVSMQQSRNESTQDTEGENRSSSKQIQKGTNENHSQSSGSSDGNQSSHSTNRNISDSRGTSKSISESTQTGWNNSHSTTEGSSTSYTLDKVNKQASEYMKYIDEELLPRIKLGFSKGLFRTSIYYMADYSDTANRLKSCITSLFQGDKSTYSPLTAQNLLMDRINHKVLDVYQTQRTDTFQESMESAVLRSRPLYNSGKEIGLCTYMTSREISLIAGIPQKEVPGILLKEGVDFGLNAVSKNDGKKADQIDLGKIMNRGVETKISYTLDLNMLEKHTFIAGVTGSGKTTTCHRLLQEACKEDASHFLVIEPAKTEYRTLIKPEYHFNNVIVFTLGNEMVAPFRLNPFELVKGEVLSAHVDMMKAAFTSAFPMEASMPQLLEEAIYACYKESGWDIDESRHKEYGDAAYDGSHECFPILYDLLTQLKTVVESKGFDTKLKNDYIGSLVSRLSHLTEGSKGRMLNCFHSIDFQQLVHHNVVLELDELKSPEDKSLIMGFILMRLNAVVRNIHKSDPDFRHITLVEEAHRLLSKVEYGDGGAKKSSVETFTDMLAEVRKYKESLIIVDQIPNKLAPEVMKNTNTKIIHKILARDDKEAVGDTMLMDDKQKEYLSALGVGETVIFSGNTDKPVNVKIKQITDTNEEEVQDDLVKERFICMQDQFGKDVYKWDELNKLCSLYMDVEFPMVNTQEDLDARKEKICRLKNEVDSLVKRTGVDEDTVWHKILEWYYKKTGNPSKKEALEEACCWVTQYLIKNTIPHKYADAEARRIIRKML